MRDRVIGSDGLGLYILSREPVLIEKGDSHYQSKTFSLGLNREAAGLLVTDVCSLSVCSSA